MPDPLAAVSTGPKAWFDGEAGTTGAALLERFQQRGTRVPVRTI